MTRIIIHVTKQTNGYTFSVLPSIRQKIRVLFPDAYPATSIFIGYDTNITLEAQSPTLHHNICLTLLGIRKENFIFEKIKEIIIVDGRTGDIMRHYSAFD